MELKAFTVRLMRESLILFFALNLNFVKFNTQVYGTGSLFDLGLCFRAWHKDITGISTNGNSV